jgi:Holliday junction DNA helicase RuvB
MDTGEDGELLLGYYPDGWDEFVGQREAKRELMIRSRSAKARGVPLGHTLLNSAVPGIGKTSLALLTAREIGSFIRIMSGPIGLNDVPYLFMDMKDGDVLFLDEIHQLVRGGKGNAEWLLHYLENGVLFGPLGSEQAPKVTIIGATTDAGRLPKTILDRFEIQPTLHPYDDEEGALIAVQLSRKVLVRDGLPEVTLEVGQRIARAANNSPRPIRRILCAVRDLVFAGEIAEHGGDYDVTEALSFAGVTEDGLSTQMVKYLLLLMRDFHGNPTGERVLADRLGEVGNGMRELERVLLDKELIGLTGRGRMLTVNGMRRARQLAGK